MSDAPKDTGAAEMPPSSGHVAFWGLVLFAGCRAIQIFLEAQSMAAAVGQAVLVEWGAARLGVGWSPPGREPTTKLVAARAGVGALVGFGAAAVLFAVLAATRAISFESAGTLSVPVLAIGLVTAAVGAWRDELLLHGIAIRALDGTSVGAVPKVVACGLTSAGLALGGSDATARTVFVAALLGILFGALWVRDRGAWQPWSAHVAFRFATGTLLSGGIAHFRLAGDTWGGGDAGVLGGTAAVVALAPLAVLALARTLRTTMHAPTAHNSPKSAK